MKKITLILFVIASFTRLFAQTTLEEYNYATKGYKIQVESGLDMKKGYLIVDLHENSVETNTDKGIVKRTMKFKGLYRSGEINPCAIMVVFRRFDNDFVDYICLPHWKSSKDIWDLYFNQIKTYTEGGREAMMWGLAKSAAYFSQNN